MEVDQMLKYPNLDHRDIWGNGIDVSSFVLLLELLIFFMFSTLSQSTLKQFPVMDSLRLASAVNLRSRLMIVQALMSLQQYSSTSEIKHSDNKWTILIN